jgi:hypothetical protein
MNTHCTLCCGAARFQLATGGGERSGPNSVVASVLVHVGPNIVLASVLVHVGPNIVVASVLVHVGPNIVVASVLVHVRFAWRLGGG